MLACNCLNVVIELENIDKITKEALELSEEEKCDSFFQQEYWHSGRLLNINKVYSGLVSTRTVESWSISHCLNCDVHTHAIHKDKGASFVLVNFKLLNQESISNIKSSDLFSTIFRVVVNPNEIGPDNTALETYPNKDVDKVIRDLNEVVTNSIRKEQAAVEERIKLYCDEQYEMLNTLKDKAYKEREALVRIIHNAAREGTIQQEPPKTPKGFGDLIHNKPSVPSSPTTTPFSPKRPKNMNTANQAEGDFADDLLFDFETDDKNVQSLSSRNLEDSDLEEVEEAEDAVNEASGITIFHARSKSNSGSSIAKSCPVDIPIFSLLSRSKTSPSDVDVELEDEFSPRREEQVDIAASIKALARSVHGDPVFGELPRPRFSTQI